MDTEELQRITQLALTQIETCVYSYLKTHNKESFQAKDIAKALGLESNGDRLVVCFLQRLEDQEKTFSDKPNNYRYYKAT